MGLAVSMTNWHHQLRASPIIARAVLKYGTFWPRYKMIYFRRECYFRSEMGKWSPFEIYIMFSRKAIRGAVVSLHHHVRGLREAQIPSTVPTIRLKPTLCLEESFCSAEGSFFSAEGRLMRKSFLDVIFWLRKHIRTGLLFLH